LECLEFRRICEVEPNRASPDLLAHAKECSACARHLRRARRVDALIGTALRIDVPGSDVHVVDIGARRRRARRWPGIAAGVVIACGVGVALWFAPPERPALASEVVDHVSGEPAALRTDSAATDTASVEGLLAPYGVRLSEAIGPITYFMLCPFHGTLVPHFVVRGPEGPVTVLILTDRPVSKASAFTLGDFSGEIVPARRGSIAVVGYRRQPDGAEETRILEAISFERPGPDHPGNR
jgi:hypothetical protein